jgi:hypothetical protein
MQNKTPTPQSVPMATQVRERKNAHLQEVKASISAQMISKFRWLVIEQIDAAMQRMDSPGLTQLDEAVDGNTGNARIIIDTTTWASHTNEFRDAIISANLSTLWPYQKAVQEVMSIVLDQIGREGGWNVKAAQLITNDVNKDFISDKIILEEPNQVVKKPGWIKRMMSAFLN